MMDFEIEIMGEKNDKGLHLCKEFLDAVEKIATLQNISQKETINPDRGAMMHWEVKISVKEKWF